MPNLPLSQETIFAQEVTAELLLPLSGVVMPSPNPELPVICSSLSAAQQPWSRASLVTSLERDSCPLISCELTLLTWKSSWFGFFSLPLKCCNRSLSPCTLPHSRQVISVLCRQPETISQSLHREMAVTAGQFHHPGLSQRTITDLGTAGLQGVPATMRKWELQLDGNTLLPKDEDGQIPHCTVITALEAMAAAVGEGQSQMLWLPRHYKTKRRRWTVQPSSAEA